MDRSLASGWRRIGPDVGAELRAMMPWSEEGKKAASGAAGQQGSKSTPEKSDQSERPARRPAVPLPR